jgi:protease secretion system outer membrane protein
MKKKIVIASIFAAFTCTTSLQAHAIGLLQAYQAALNNDTNFRGAKADKVAGQEYEVIGRAGLLPTVQYSYATSKNKGELISVDFFGFENLTNQDYRSTSKGFSLRQPLFNLDLYARFQQGVAQTAYSEAQFDVKKSDLMLRVLGAYSEAKYAEDQVKYYTAQRDAYLEQKLINENMYKKGEGTKTEMLETQAKLDVAEALILEAQDNQFTSRNTLASITGLDINELEGLSDTFSSLTISPTDYESWKRIALAQNPEVLSARYALDIAEKEVTKSYAAHAPRLDLTAGYTNSISESLATRGQNSSVRNLGIQIVIPIYSGGYAHAVSKQTVAHLEKAKADLAGTENKVLIELRKQYSALRSSVAKIEAMQNSVLSAKTLIEATKQSIKGGLRINVDLLNAYQQLVYVQRDLANARYSYLMSYLKLKIAAGNATENDLREIAASFNVKD